MPTKYYTQRIRTERKQRHYTDGVLDGDFFTPDGTLNGDSYRVTERQSPGWKSRIAIGEDATTEMSAVRQHWKYRPAFCSVATLWDHPYAGPISQRWEMEGDFAPISNNGDSADVPSEVLLVDQQALTRFISDARAAQSALKGLVTLGELGESLHMLRNPAMELRKRLTSYVDYTRAKHYRYAEAWRRRVNRGTSRRVLRDQWLEYSFGWAPLVNDIKDAKQAIDDAVELRQSQFVTGSALKRALANQDLQRSVVNYASGSYLRAIYDQVDIYTITCRYYGRVKLKAINPAGPRLLRQTFGFTWQDFVPSIWELIPYSFLVDYFSNIGDIISVLTFQESELKWKSRTTRVVLDREITNFVFLPPILAGGDAEQVTDLLVYPPVQKHESKTLERLRVTWPLIIDFRFKIPGLGLKWLNIAALAKMRSLTPPSKSLRL